MQVSDFAGAADYNSFDLVNHISNNKTVRVKLSEKENELNQLYKEIRDTRNSDEIDSTKLQDIFKNIKGKHSTYWLLPLEICELAIKKDLDFSEEVLKHLIHLKQERTKMAHLIEGGLALLETHKKEIIN